MPNFKKKASKKTRRKVEGPSLRDRLSIDKLALDDELVQQPGLFYEAADKYADALRNRDEAREDQKLVQAEIETRIREEWDGDKKPTVKEVDAEVEKDRQYQLAREQYKDAEAELVRADGLREAFRQRANVLSALARLQQDSAYQHDHTSADPDTVRARRKIREKSR